MFLQIFLLRHSSLLHSPTIPPSSAFSSPLLLQVTMHIFLFLLSISAPLLLGAPTSPNANSPSSLLAKRYIVNCFTNLPGHHLAQPVITDCTAALRQVLCGEKTSAPMHFSTKHGFTVPHRWVHGTCNIVIDTVSDEDENQFDIFSLTDIVDRAVELLGRCINDARYKYGGRTTVGPKDEFTLLMFGGEAEEYEPARYPPRCWLN